MNAALAKAKELLLTGGYTCVICGGELLYTSQLRGVKPLLDLLDSGQPLQGCSAADRVVGKAAAFLYLRFGVKEVYALVISTPARELLTENGVAVYCDREVPAIRNRTDTGFCPMETAVLELDQPEAAEAAIRQRLADLQQGK